MVDRVFAEPRLAELYDVLHPWAGRGDFGFYLPLVMSAGAVLDVGCGTGELLRRARQEGHTGRLCGLDPADAMLDQARIRSDIEWVVGDLASVAWNHEFDLIVMSGHAFQVFVSDDEIRASLGAVHAALADGGRFAFETRNPLARSWEQWHPGNAVEVACAAGTVRMAHQVESVDGDLVSFVTTFTCTGWEQPQLSHSTLRFLDVASLAAFLSEAQLTIDVQFGDWDRQALRTTSPEVITIARGI
jgi:SAM-dependent methyltransferase